MVQIEKETENTWKFEVGNNTNIANFVSLWKIQNKLTQRYQKIVQLSVQNLQC